MTILSATLLLVLVMDPVGNIPFFLAALDGVAAQRRRWVILRELVIALIALLVFLFAGQRLLNVLQISEPSLTIAGAIILFLIALKMTFPGSRGLTEDSIDGEPFVVPLAIPFIAGPSALATVLLIMNQEPARWAEWLVAVSTAWAITGVILFGADAVGRFLGRRGMVAIERLMGMILTAIAVQMFLTGLRRFMAG